MANITLRPGRPEDANAVLRLNTASVKVTSPMDWARLEQLVGLASLYLVVEEHDRVVGFLLAMGDQTSYDSPNYRWFVSRLKGVLYIDRVVVAADRRGAGLGSHLYRQAEQWARDAGLYWLAAEIDLDPPNVDSLRFHDRVGFLQLGTQRLDHGKLESMRVKPLQP